MSSSSLLLLKYKKIQIFCGLFVLILLLSESSANLLTKNSLKLIRKVYEDCASNGETYKCLKIQALKVMDRALHSRNIILTDGLNLISDSRQARMLLANSPPLNQSKLEKLKSEEIDDMLVDRTARFMDTHKLEVNISKFAGEARQKGGAGGGGGGFGGFGGGKGGGQGAALLWALGIKGSFLLMAYKGIAIMAGTALIVGKMALLLSAILGLKKLVSSNDKTTFEIVKHPKYSESHTHSSSYEDEGHYHRTLDLAAELRRGQNQYYSPYFVRKS